MNVSLIIIQSYNILIGNGPFIDADTYVLLLKQDAGPLLVTEYFYTGHFSGSFLSPQSHVKTTNYHILLSQTSLWPSLSLRLSLKISLSFCLFLLSLSLVTVSVSLFSSVALQQPDLTSCIPANKKEGNKREAKTSYLNIITKYIYILSILYLIMYLRYFYFTTCQTDYCTFYSHAFIWQI